jgi:peptidyl-prolyl cis-trans isomerase B (cyclophilin B)
MKLKFTLLLCFLLNLSLYAADSNLVAMAPKASYNPVIRMITNQGVVLMELYPDKAPETVKNFIDHIKTGGYDNTLFHRVIKQFMIQGGGMEPGLKARASDKLVKNEADNGLKNERYTIAMARTSNPHSANNQFFINTATNRFLDHTGRTPQGWGYCVFGKVISGFEIVNKIEMSQTSKRDNRPDVPVVDVVIEKMVVLEESD